MGTTSDEDRANALVALCSVIRGLLSEANRGEVLARHHVGTILLEATESREKYGKRSIETIAADLGLHPRLLYRHIAVAESWSAVQIAVDSRRTNRSGQVLTWSHFLALTKVRDAASRRAAMEKCLSRAWSVRELEHHIAQMAGAPPRGSEASRDGEPVHAALREWIQMSDRAIADLRMFEDAFDERLGEMNEPLSEALIDRTLRSLDELHARAVSAASRIRGVTQSQDRIRVAAPVGNRRAVSGAAFDASDANDDKESLLQRFKA